MMTQANTLLGMAATATPTDISSAARRARDHVQFVRAVRDASDASAFARPPPGVTWRQVGYLLGSAWSGWLVLTWSLGFWHLP